jgi:pimeloyl-ACP methyl ester carboxylesterase
MEYFDCGSARLVCKIYGSGENTLVIDTAIGTCSAEWWHIAEALGSKYRVLVFDRAGYGESSVSELPRSPRNISKKLNKLLIKNNIDKNVILIGHSQGGLYAVEYALMFPDCIKGIILLDPATPFDHEFAEKLTKDEYKKSGVDKTLSFKLGKVITSLGLGFTLKPLYKKAPPFYYYNFSNSAKEYLLKSLCKKPTYTTALEEYKYTHNIIDTKDIINTIEKKTLRSIPVKLITHSSDFISMNFSTLEIWIKPLLKKLRIYGRIL